MILANAARLGRQPWFWAVNETVRRFYLKVLTPILQWHLRDKLGVESLRLIPRHSVLSTSAFNAFESDLDFSVIFEKEPTQIELRVLRELFASVRSVIPSVAEFEVYLSWEVELRGELQEGFAAYLDVIASLRKWKWQWHALESAKSGYHAEKALRSIQKIRRNLGISPGPPCPSLEDSLELGRIIARLLDPVYQGALSAPIQADVYSSFLEWQIQSDAAAPSRQQGFRIVVDADHALEFASVLPDGEHMFPGEETAICKLRENGAVADILSAITAAEFLLVRSVQRTCGDPLQTDIVTWLGDLSRILRTHSGGSLRSRPCFAVLAAHCK